MRKSFCILLGIIIVMVLSDCASMKAPQGGPKDSYPPQVLESEPPNHTTDFQANKITLRFNEFVAVSDIAQEVFISPPLRNIPEIKTRGKSVIISIEEELHDSTTYSIFFGKSIKDITEGNPMENYTYVFSTGDYIDSLSVIGEVINAFDLQPRQDVLVMLYEDENDSIPFDSLPFMVKPSYLTRTNESGFFVIKNLREGNYKMFGLSDENLSAIYDNAEENVAFLDSMIAPAYLASEPLDTSLTDSLDMLVESLLPDTLSLADSLQLDTVIEKEDFYTLFMFQETPDTIQRLLEADKPREQVLRFIFRYPADDVMITPVTPVPNEWMVQEWNKGMDTLRYYILSNKMDTISLRIWQDTIVYDTVSWSLRKAEIPMRKKDKEQAQVLRVFDNLKSPFPYYDTLEIKTGYPFREVDFQQFMLVENNDTLIPEFDIYDQAGRMFRLRHQLKEQANYTLFFPDSVLYDILGKSNDSTQIRFNTNSYEDYGLYKIHVANASTYDHLMIQLMTEDEKVVRENTIGADRTVEWDLLQPGKYVIKAYADLNNNRKWDTGDYLEKRQPEPVVYFPGVIEVRAGWSFEEEWSVKFK